MPTNHLRLPADMTAPTPRRRTPRVRLTVALAGAILLIAAPAASAHNVLISGDPAAGFLLDKAPTTVTLVFDEDADKVHPEMAITIGSLSN